MTAQVQFTCDQHPDARTCPDKLVDYVPKFNEYGLLIPRRRNELPRDPLLPLVWR